MAFYFGATVLNLLALLGERGKLQRIAFILSIIGIVAQTAGMALRGIRSHQMPFFNISESVVFVAWLLMLIYIWLERRHRITALGFFANLTALTMVTSTWVLLNNADSYMPAALRSHWSNIHIISCLIAYSSFVLAFGATLVYALQEQMLRTKRINALQRNLPSLDGADRLAYRMVAFGFPMLTLGVVTGALWAQTAWGSYWNWDPKETWAFITWLVYAAYLHVRIVSGRRGKWPKRLIVTGFCCILITFFGVNLLPYGLHKYY